MVQPCENFDFSNEIPRVLGVGRELRPLNDLYREPRSRIPIHSSVNGREGSSTELNAEIVFAHNASQVFYRLATDVSVDPSKVFGRVCNISRS